MTVERRVLHTGVDSWEGEMTCRSTTYKVEVEQRDRQGVAVWDLEVLREGRRFLFLGTVEMVHYSAHPTLDAALDAAQSAIRGLATHLGSFSPVRSQTGRMIG